MLDIVWAYQLEFSQKLKNKFKTFREIIKKIAKENKNILLYVNNYKNACEHFAWFNRRTRKVTG